MNQPDLKVVLLGNEAVGKTSLMRRYVHERFANKPHQNTIGAAFASKVVSSKNGDLVLGIWDTAGSERYYAMSQLYYRAAKAAVICFDVTDGQSFTRAKEWVTEVRNREPNCKIYLCGTQKDVVDDDLRARNVSHEKIMQYAKGIQSMYFETSSKTGENVVELFQTIADECELPAAQSPGDLIKVQCQSKAVVGCCRS